MKTIVLSLLLAATPIIGFAGGLDIEAKEDCENKGGDYDIISGCVVSNKPSRKLPTEPAPKTQNMVSVWKRLALDNTHVVMNSDTKGCELRGGAHKEPDLGGVTGVKAIKIDRGLGDEWFIPIFSDCELENSKFAGSDTSCKIEFIWYDGGESLDSMSAAPDLGWELVGNTSGLSTDPKAFVRTKNESKMPIKSFSVEAIDDVFKNMLPSMAGSEGPACRLQKEFLKKVIVPRGGVKPKSGSGVN